MKKKLLLLTVFVMLFVCLFVVSASAKTIYKDTEGNTLFSYVDDNGDKVFDSYEGSFPTSDEQENALTWYITESKEENGNTVHVVASFNTLDKTGTYASLSDAGVYKYVNKAMELSVVSVYFPNDAGILTLSLSDDGYGDAYSYASNTSNLLFLRLPNTLTTLPFRIAQSTPIIDCTIDENAPFTSFSNVSFHDSQNLRSVDIPKNVTILQSKGHSNDGFTFYRCVSLVDVDFAEGSQLVTIEQNAFNSCTALKEITIPNSVVNLGNNVFMYCSGLETIRLGANAGKNLATYNVQSMLYGCNSLKYVYMSSTMIPTTGSHLFDSGAGSMVIFYTGDYSQYEALKTTLTNLKNNGKFVNATPIEWNSINSDQYYKNLATTEKKNYVVYGYSACEAFYNGNHVENDTVNGSVCYLADCSRCNVEKKDISSDATHSLNTQYVYANGYMSAGQIISICQNAGCAHGTESTAITNPLDALFNNLEYSVAEKGFGICVKYNVNKDALAVYKNSGKSISFGVVAVMADMVENNGPLANDGKLTTEKNVVAADVTADNLRAVTLRISGDESAWRAHSSKAIYVLGYATNGTDLEYLGTASGAQVDRNNITSVKSLVIGQFFNFNA